MKTTNMPGFTAEASLFSRRGHYQQLATDFNREAAVHLALRISRGPLAATCTSTDGSRLVLVRVPAGLVNQDADVLRSSPEVSRPSSPRRM